MTKNGVACGSLVLLLVAAGLRAAPQEQGRAILSQACVQCHDLTIVASQQKTEAGWRRTVNEMIWRGAPLLAGEAEVLSKHLAGAFGPQQPVPRAGKKAARDAPKGTVMNENAKLKRRK